MTPNGKTPSIRLYVAETLDALAQVTLQHKQTHYLAHVMRRKVNDWVLLFNEQDGEWLAEITEIRKKALTVRLIERTRMAHSVPDCWLVCAPIKSGHLEPMIEKATELGVAEIHLMKTQHMAVKRVNEERLHAIATEAAEQSERLDVPVIHPLAPLRQLLADWPEERLLFYGDETGQGALFDREAAEDVLPKQWAVMVGPEGGFAEEELALLRAHPAARGISLGPRILRADTASTTLLSLTMSQFGDWSKKPAFRGAQNG